MAHASEWGRRVRRRRLELGLSQARVAESVGVPVVRIGRWERGEEIPGPRHIRALAAALDLDPEDAGGTGPALPAAEPPVPDVEEEEALAPPLELVEGGLEGDPWSVPPERRIRPPRLDRDALTGRAAGSRAGRTRPEPAPDEPAVIPIAGPGGDPAAGRRSRDDDRRRRRDRKTAERRERHREAAEARAREEADGRAARRAVLPPAPDPGNAPPPATSANTGSVFPVPDSRRLGERVTYRSLGDERPENERLTYAVRVLLTVAVLLVLAGLLWWAFTSLGDGIGAVLDLLRGDPEPEEVSDALRLLVPG